MLPSAPCPRTHYTGSRTVLRHPEYLAQRGEGLLYSRVRVERVGKAQFGETKPS